MEIYEVNLEEGRPIVREAMDQLERTLKRAKASDCKVMKFIHGYGSSGKGGKIRKAARANLNDKLARGEVAQVIPGENFNLFHSETQKAMCRHFFISSDSDMGKNNLGITVVVLK